jgi:hypothetical protein
MFNHRGGRALADAVTEIILVCRLSQKHMWDKVNLDIHGMMRARLAPLGKPTRAYCPVLFSVFVSSLVRPISPSSFSLSSAG